MINCSGFKIKKASPAFQIESLLENTLSMRMSCMLLGVWLVAERKCFATVIGLDSLLFKNAVVFIKSVFYFVISHGRDRVLRENAAHASIPFCSLCVKK